MRVQVGDGIRRADLLCGLVLRQSVQQIRPVSAGLRAGRFQIRLQPEDLLNLSVRSADGRMVTLSTLASLGPFLGPPLITLYNLYPSATIVGSPGGGWSSGQAMKVMGSIAATELPKDMSYEWSAMSYQGRSRAICSMSASHCRSCSSDLVLCGAIRAGFFSACGHRRGAAGADRSGGALTVLGSPTIFMSRSA